MSDIESVSGSILEIPEGALKSIQDAETAIKNLGETSKRTAEAVKTHWSTIATDGLNTFIQKVRDASTELGKISSVDTKSSTSGISSLGETSSSTASDISRLVAQIDRMVGLMSSWESGVTRAASSTKSLEVDVDGLVARLSRLNPRDMNIAELTQAINEIQASLRRQGVSDPDLERQLVAAKQQLLDIRKLAETPTNNTLLQAEKERNTLLREQAQIQKELANVTKNIQVTNAKGGVVSPETLDYASKLQARLSDIEDKIRKVESRLGGVGEESRKAWETKQAIAYAKAMKDIDDALRRVKEQMAKKDETDLSRAQSEYGRVLAEIDKVIAAQQKFRESLAAGGLDSTTQTDVTAGLDASIKRLDELEKRRKELSDKYGAELNSIQAKHDVKRGEQSLKAHEKAEKDKTKATRDAARERYEAEMRELRKLNAEETLLNKKRSASRADAKERDRIESLARLRAQIEETKRAIESLDKTDKDYEKNLERLNKQLNELYAIENKVSNGSKKLKSETDKLNSSISGLERRIATVFSIGAIGGFLKKMTEVYAQFELQKTALRAIIQNKREADEVYSKVQQMALQSPFTIMQLTTYTKQLAAYRVEANKLVDTTKMLADVSAGLGVDMQRLILAYGQVKSANYLRATEVRQFTEAGLNIAGELAKYFSEIQGKMVSVGDVMDMITKRMVKFEDVEEIFKRITSAGGLFYDMQKKQSETVYGQIQRISDAWSIMLNDIGKQNQGVIKGVLASIRWLINGWRDVLNVLKPVVTAWASYKIVIGAVALANTKFVKTVGTMLQFLGKFFKSGMKFKATMELMKISATSAVAGIAGLIGVIGGLVWSLISLGDTRLKLDLTSVADETKKDFEESQKHFADMVIQMDKNLKSEEERKKILEDLRREYDGILPKYMLEAEYLEKLNGNYENINAKLREYYELKKRQAQLDTISQSEEWQNVLNKINEGVEDAINIYGDDSFLNASKGFIIDAINANEEAKKQLADANMTVEQFVNNVQISETELAAVMRRAAEGFKNNGVVFKDQKEAMQAMLDEVLKYYKSKGPAFAEVLKNLFNVKGSLHNTGMEEWAKEYVKNIQTGLKYLDQPLLGDTSDATEKAAMDERIYSKIQEAIDSVAPAMEQFNKNVDDGVEKLNELSEAGANVEKSGIEDLDQATQAAVFSVTGLKELQDSLKFEQLEKLFNTINQNNGDQINVDSVKEMFLVYKQMAEIDPTNAEQFLNIILQIVNQSDNVKLFGEQFVEEVNKESEALKVSIANHETNVKERQKFNKIIAASLAKLTAEERKALINDDNIRKSKTESMEEYNKRMQELYKKNLLALQSYLEAKAKGFAESWLMLHNMQASDIKLMEAENKYISTGYAPRAGLKLYTPKEKKEKKKKEKKGTDPEVEMWNARISALKEYFTELEKAEKKMSGSKLKKTMEDSFVDLWKETKLDQFLPLNQIIAMGFDPKKLKDDAQQAFKWLKEKVPPKYEKAIRQIQKEISKYQVEIDFKIQDEAKEKLVKEMDEMLSNYELTKELRNLGMNIDLTFVLGGKPISSILELRRKLYETFYESFEAGKLGDEAIKDFEKMLKKIDDLELKSQKERAKNLHKYTTEAMAERFRIQRKYDEEMAKVEESEDMGRSTKKLAIDNLMKEREKELDELAWKTFQESELYVDLFENIEYASKDAIEYMLNRLEDLRGSLKNLPADQVRAIVKQMDDLRERSYQLSNPFKLLAENIVPAIKNIGKLKDAQKQLNVAETNVQTLQSQRDMTAKDILAYEEQLSIEKALLSDKKTEYEAAKRNNELTAVQLKDLKDVVDNQEKNVSLLETQLLLLNGSLSATDNLLSKEKARVKSLRQQVKDAKELKEKLAIGFGGVSEIFGQMSGFASQMKDDFQQIFGTQGAAFEDTMDTISEVMDGLSNLTGGIQALLQGDVINGVFQTVTGLFSTVSSFFAIGDKKKERQIQSLTKRVEKLKKAYDDLSESIDRAFAIDDYQLGFDNAMANLEAQKKAYLEMLNLEKAKKKYDEEKIQEYQDALDELAKAEEELRRKRIEAMGSTTDSLSQAESAVDAWLSNFRDLGDGIDGLKDNWDSFMDSLVKKQAARAVVSKRLDAIISGINDAIDDGKAGLDLANIVRDAGAQWQSLLPQINQELKEFFDAFGVNLGDGNLILSDLQKGIQNITEPQAAAIEAYLNSMRFAVYRHTEQLDELLSAIRSQYNEQSNTLSSYVKDIRDMFRSFWDRFSQLTEVQTGRGWVLKVN